MVVADYSVVTRLALTFVDVWSRGRRGKMRNFTQYTTTKSPITYMEATGVNVYTSRYTEREIECLMQRERECLRQ